MFARIDADQGGAIMDHRITFAEPLDDSQRRLVDPRKFDRPVQRMPGVPLQSVCDGFSEAEFGRRDGTTRLGSDPENSAR